MKCDRESLRKAMLLYAVTDRTWLGGQALSAQVEECVKAGVTFLQLREKNMDFDAFAAEAKVIKQIADTYQVPFVINDNIEVALACDADGVHVGQSDMETGNVCALLGEDKIIGVSVHTVEEAKLAEARGADYLGVGAAFSTSTKLDANTIPMQEFRAIADSVSIPVVAIGGISAQNILQLSGSGVDGVAVVSAIFAQKDIAAATKCLLELAKKMVNA